MNELQSSAGFSEQIAVVRIQFFIVLLALIVITASLAGYLYLQQRFTGRDIAAIQPQATQIIHDFNQNIPAITNFVQHLILYGQTHPDFQQQVLKKYPFTAQSPGGIRK